MAAPLCITIPHQLGRAEARRRIQSGFANLVRQLPGSAGNFVERWDGDRLTFSIGALGQAASGTVDVAETTVTMEITLPGLLGMLAGGLKGRLQQAGQLLLTKK